MGKSVRKSRKPKHNAGNVWADVIPGESSPAIQADSMQASQPGMLPIDSEGSSVPRVSLGMDDKGSMGSTESTGDTEKQNTRTKHVKQDYPDEQRIRALTAMITTNPEHPYCHDSIAAARGVLGVSVSTQTLHSWMIEFATEIRSIIPKRSHEEIISETYNEVVKQWGEVEKRYLQHLTDDYTVITASPRDAVIAAGTARDKIDKFRGLSPDIMIEIQAIIKACELGAYDVKEVFQDLRRSITEHMTQRAKIIIPATTTAVLQTDDHDKQNILSSTDDKQS